jgi:subtilisin family serine protease
MAAMPKLARLLALIALVAGAIGLAVPAAAAAAPSSAGRFIVTLKPGSDPRAIAAEYHRRDGVDVAFVYDKVLTGFAGAFGDGAFGRLQADGRVDHFTRDGVAGATVTPDWGLDRLDQHYLATDGIFAEARTGAGVDAYVIDTGIYAGHAEFASTAGSRVVSGASQNFVADTSGVVDPAAWSDCNGHGTHVAGTIGGATYGVARGVSLHAVRVLDCAGSGSWSGVIAGMNWAYSQVVAAGRPAVANMSLGGGSNVDVDNAAAQLASVATVAVAAGNDNRDACLTSPARAAGVLTIGATTNTDARASYSNYGTCVELYAPGTGITSSWIGDASASNTISGTSMATPHVAGLAALLAGTDSSPTSVRDRVLTLATPNVVSGASGASNRLAFTGSELDHPLTAGLSTSCSGTTCRFTATAADPDGAATFTWAGATAGSTTFSAGKTTGTASRTVTAPGTYTVSVRAAQGGATVPAPDVNMRCVAAKGGNKVSCSGG